MTLPDTFVVGAGRCGTTALYRALGQHPQIEVGRRKSPNHFAADIPQPAWETPAAVAMARHWIADRSEYESLFRPDDATRAVIDVSPVYLQATVVAERIHSARPDARIIAILRDPAQRAVSHFLGRRRDGIEPPSASLEDTIRAQATGPLPTDVSFGHYVGAGQYHRFLAPYLDLFGHERVLVLFHDELLADPDATFDGIFRFLDVDVRSDVRTDDSDRPNRTGEIRSPVRRWLWTRSNRLRTALRPLLPERARHRVGRGFLTELQREEASPELLALVSDALSDDTDRLSALLGRDLHHWRH